MFQLHTTEGRPHPGLLQGSSVTFKPSHKGKIVISQETIWFAYLRSGPLWLLFKFSSARWYPCILRALPALALWTPAPAPYPSTLLQTAQLRVSSPSGGILEGSPRHLSPMASGVWEIHRALTAFGRARLFPLKQSMQSVWRWYVPQRAEHDEMPAVYLHPCVQQAYTFRRALSDCSPGQSRKISEGL